jgi:hypothetical protein
MKSRMSLFRGEPAHVWVRRLAQRGWPSPLAAEMARFLTEKGAPPPAWQDVIGVGSTVSPRGDVRERKSA